MSDLKLAVFDVDGTLVDSQAHIMAAMSLAFSNLGFDVPTREAVLSLVGLSLHVMMPRLAPQADQEVHGALVQGYKDAFVQLRGESRVGETMPLFPAALETLAELRAQPNLLLGVATGKSRRGLDKVLESHGLTKTFVTEHVADHHPSKPHPSMLQACLSDTGVAAERAVMIGDTAYDMEMAKAAGLYAVGVSWGYHDRDQLAQADVIIDKFQDLPAVLKGFWG